MNISMEVQVIIAHFVVSSTIKDGKHINHPDGSMECARLLKHTYFSFKLLQLSVREYTDTIEGEQKKSAAPLFYSLVVVCCCTVLDIRIRPFVGACMCSVYYIIRSMALLL